MKRNFFVGIALSFFLSGCGPSEKTESNGLVARPPSGWLGRSGRFVYQDLSHPVGSYVKTLDVQRSDIYEFECEKWYESGKCQEGKQVFKRIELAVKYSMQENQTVTEEVSGTLEFATMGFFSRSSNPRISMTKNGELEVREYWGMPQSPPSLLHLQDLFRVSAGEVIGIERIYDEKGAKVIYEHEAEFLPQED